MIDERSAIDSAPPMAEQETVWEAAKPIVCETSFLSFSTRVFFSIRLSRSDPTSAIAPLSDEPAQAAAGTYTFICTNGLKFQSRIVAPETVEIRLPKESRVLKQERSASGAKYTDGAITFWNKGRETMLDLGDRVYACAQDDTETVP